MQKIVVLSGAGISQESGISTFRDAGGLWEKYDVTALASPDAWSENPEPVLDFYNARRRNVLQAEPNPAHKFIAELENNYEVNVITQNVDDLHERAGSTQVLHLHGEIRKARSTSHPDLVYEIFGSELNMGDLCAKGSQLRPHIVWFGEAVPAMDEAVIRIEDADIMIVIGTSLQVYPAAGLTQFAPAQARKFLIDPSDHITQPGSDWHVIREKAVKGVQILATYL